MTSRERKLRYFTDDDRSALEDAVCRYVAKHGPDFLPDDFLDELVSIEVRRRRADHLRMIRNRPKLRASLGLTGDGLANALGALNA